jgi:molybdate transport system substrate-binding protein
MDRRKLAIVLIYSMFFMVGTLPAQTIRVAVAANAQFVIEAIKKEFEKETAIQVELIIGSSGKLTAQIAEGAPYDIFVSADMKYPTELFYKGFAVAFPKIYASGILVIWTTKPELKIKNDLQILLCNGIKTIAIANPRIAPYGIAAEEVLTNYKLYEKVKDKIVFGESISQVNQYILTKAADAGFTAKSIVLSEEYKHIGSWIDVDPKMYNPIVQGCVILHYGKENHSVATQKFYDFIFSKRGQELFKKFGYII